MLLNTRASVVLRREIATADKSLPRAAPANGCTAAACMKGSASLRNMAHERGWRLPCAEVRRRLVNCFRLAS